MNKRLYIKSDGQALGPATVDEIRSLMEGGWVSGTDAGRWEDEEEWKTIDSLLALLPQTNENQSAATDSKPKTFKVVLPKQTVRKRATIWIFLACLAIVVGVGYWAYPGRSQSKTEKTQASNTARQTNFVYNPPVAPVPLIQSSTNLPVPVVKPASTNALKSAPKPAAIPTIPTVSIQPTNATAPMQQVAASRRQVVTTGNVKGIGEYDAALIRKVQKRWLDLVERAHVAGNRTGGVALEFQLHANGLIDHVRVLQNDTDDLLGFLCESAISESAPFPPWPNTMRRSIKSDTRLMQFTFRY